jgi:hypothetical protein
MSASFSSRRSGGRDCTGRRASPPSRRRAFISSALSLGQRDRCRDRPWWKHVIRRSETTRLPHLRQARQRGRATALDVARPAARDPRTIAAD